MRFAAIDTSTEWCSVALWQDGEIAAVESFAGQRHAERVLPMLDELLARAGRKADALDAVAFGAGPGSFTGVRVACAVAQGLAFARGIPVIGISTLEAIAEASGTARAIACIDARMREVYMAAFERDDAHSGAWRTVIAPVCVPPGAVPRPSGTGWIGCGNGFRAWGDELGAALGDALRGVRSEIRAHSASVVRLAAARLLAGEGVDAADAAPLYVRDKVALTTEERHAS